MKRNFLLSILIWLFLSLYCKAQDARYIFLIFGDGMSLNAIAATENYLSYLDGKPLGYKKLAFRQFPYAGLVDNASAVSSVSGSSEAATALFCGTKSGHGYVGVDADGAPVESIFTALHKKGYKVGVMSTDPINHATPAAVYAHATNRDDYRNITRQLPAAGFDFLAGESFIDFEDVQDGMNADEFMAKNGYHTYNGTKEFASRGKNDGKPILVYERCRSRKSDITAETDKNKNYTLHEESDDFTPAKMLDCCLECFGSDQPFIILLEEGEIDHAAHLNATMSVVDGILKLDEAASHALEFYKRHPEETLILVFTDHETGGLTIANHHRGSDIVNWKALIEDRDAGRENGREKKDNRKLARECNLFWATGSHTGGPTPIFAIGQGAERFTGCMDNTEVGLRIMSGQRK